MRTDDDQEQDPLIPVYKSDFVAPHQKSKHFYIRYFQWLVDVTRKYPRFSKFSFTALSLITVPAIAAVWVLPLLGVAVASIVAWPVTVGILLIGVFATACVFFQKCLFGFKFNADKVTYREKKEITHEKAPSAKAEIICEDGKIPCINITADTFEDAGFIEGYALAPQLADCYKQMTRFFWAIALLIGAPRNDEKLIKELEPLLQQLPKGHLAEIKAKIEGYNAWQKENPYAPKIKLGRYLLIQLLPDFHQFNPFRQSPLKNPTFGCTAIVVRAGDWVAYVRNLDWPSYNLGSYFLEIKRNIKEVTYSTCDISMPILSGALTVLNPHLLVQMNVGRGNTVTNIEGKIPSMFLNRKVAENYANIEEILKAKKAINPISSYHLNICDGTDAASIHTLQHPTDKGEHHIEILEESTNEPKLMVVANNGLIWSKAKTSKSINHHDSNERIKNIQACFNHQVEGGEYKQFFDTKEESTDDSAQKHSPVNSNALFDRVLPLARLPQVCNYHTVLTAVYLFHKGDLVSARAAYDNHQAADRPAEDFQTLSIYSGA